MGQGRPEQEGKPPVSTIRSNQYTGHLQEQTTNNIPASHYANRMTEAQVAQKTAQPPTKQQSVPLTPVGYSVAPDALKDPEAVKNFLNSFPGIVNDNTSMKSKLQSVDTSTVLSQFSKDHPFITGMLPGGAVLNIASAFGFGKPDDKEQTAVFQKFKEENPNFVPSLAEAVKNGSPEAIEELQKLTSGKDGSSYFTEDEMKQITGAAKTASWNAIKENWFTNLPKVASLFLRQVGLGNTVADFAKNPLGFYGGLLALLFGGGMLLSGGGGNDPQPQVVNNYYGAPQPAGYNRIPYM